MHSEIKHIDVDRIIPNTYQPRKYFDEDALNELSISVREHGILQPLTVRKNGENYELVAGERRLRAAKLANLNEVPCIIVQITDVESAELALLENLQRENLNFIEEAEAYNNLIKDHNFTQDKLAQRMGKSQSTVANKMRLLKLDDEVRKIILENNLTERHARAMLSLPTKQLQIKVIKKVVKSSLNVKKTEELINKELLKLAGEEISSDGKKKITGIFSSKIYINSIKQIFDKFKIPAQYNSKDCGEYVEIRVKIPKNDKK